jgi:trehalose utilization protein
MSNTNAPIRVTVWNEYRHEREHEAVAKIYPGGIHATIAQGLQDQLGQRVTARTATLDEPEHGLTAEVLDQTDVLTWWGHKAHGQVSDEIVDRVQQRVLGGMGLIVLHSGHFSKPFKRLMGTGCGLRWREAAEREILWCTAPGHPIAAGLEDEKFELPQTEMYGEFFDIPTPDELIFISWFEGGEVFRSGCTWTRGHGRVFYFRPGHETFPIYHDATVQRIIANGVLWAHQNTRPAAYLGNKGRNIKQPLAPIAAEHGADPDLHR